MPTMILNPRILIVAVPVLMVAVGAGFLLEGASAGDPFVQDFLYAMLFCSCAVACLARGFSGPRRDRLGWAVVGVGVAVASGGYVYDAAVLVHQDTPPYPSPSDVMWAGLYPFLYAGIVLLVREWVGPLLRGLWLDGVLGSLAVAALGSALLFDPILYETGGVQWTVATNLIYPLADLCLIGVLVWLRGLAGRSLGGSWWLLLAALCVNLIGDAVYLLQTAAGTYEPGTPISATWPATMALLVIAAYWPSRPRTEKEVAPGVAVVAPVAVVSLAAALLIVGNFHDVHDVAAVLAAVALIGGASRMFTASRQLRELRGLLPICASCKSVRDDDGYWTRIESYLAQRSGARFTHGLCEGCEQALYPELSPQPSD